MPLSENTHVTFTNEHGDDCVAVVKGYADGKYKIQVRSELPSGDTMTVDESKVKELHVSDAEACPVAGGK